MIVIANEVKQPSETLDRHAALRLAMTGYANHLVRGSY